jgi:CRP-like cAMP-binding protein
MKISADMWVGGGSLGVYDPVSPSASPLFAGLSNGELAELRPTVERFSPGAALLDAQGGASCVRILLDGWAYRRKTLGDGRRQIIGFMFPGDVGSYWTPVGGARTHEVCALTPCRVLKVGAGAFEGMVQRYPVLAWRLSAGAVVDTSIIHAWLLNLGQRKAPERIAHLFCELQARLEAAGAGAVDEATTIPVTQQDLADALGMTSVHVNRVLQRLKGEGMIAIRKGAIDVIDGEGLGRLCDFDPAYLCPPSALEPCRQVLTGAER